MKAIIFGAMGQDGYYLSRLLEQEKIEVIGVNRLNSFPFNDITDYRQVAALIKEHLPGYIFHLAANSTTRHSAWKENHDTISTGSLNILEAVKEHSPATKVFLSGSGLQFSNMGKPIKETDPFQATSIYAVSRIHTVYAARYFRSLGLRIYIGYFFNHDSPRRTEKHVNRIIVGTVQRIAKGNEEILEIGDLSVKKEFGFAGDIVKAIWTLVQQNEVNEAVIGTGKAYSIEEWIVACFSQCNLDWKKYVKEKDNFNSEYSILVSDPSTIFSLGWEPRISMHELAKMMINHE